MILDNLFPVILVKWPAWERKRIHTQLDNVPAHPKPGKLSKGITKHLVEYSNLGWDIDFLTQPPNSLDMKTLDLAFFQTIQILQYQRPAKNVNKMITHMLEAYRDLPLDVCKNMWTTAQLVMNQVLLIDGRNYYKLPHAGKLKIVAKHGRNIPMRLLCKALISGGHRGCFRCQ